MAYIILVILGLCFGSFVNALVWRLHEQQTQQNNRPNRLSAKDLSILKGRSMCVHCHHTLAWHDLLPLVSWLSLGGRCRYCHKTISWQYPVVEISTAALFALSYTFWPSALSPTPPILFVLWLVFLVGFMALTLYDLRWMILPDRIIMPLQLLVLPYVLTLFIVSGTDFRIIWNALLGILFSAGLFYALFQVSKGRWIGGGDVKLAVVLGAILGGPAEALLMIFVASLLGSLVGVPLLVSGKTKSGGKLPFGPFLIGATVFVYIFGAGVIVWYKRQFLLI